MLGTVLELVGVLAVIAGCFLIAGAGLALIAAGAFTLLVVEMRGTPT